MSKRRPSTVSVSPARKVAPAELPPPEGLADDDGRRRAGRRVVGGAQHAPSQGSDAHGVEERPADPEALGIARLAARRQVDPVGAPGGELREGFLLGADALPQGRRQLRVAAGEVARAAAAGRRDPDVVEGLRIGDGQAPQPDRVDELEDRRIGADAESEREDRDEGERGLEAQAPRAVAEVLRETGEPAASLVRRRKPRRGGGWKRAGQRGSQIRNGELVERGAPGGVGGRAGGDEIGVTVLEVLCDLLDDRGLALGRDLQSLEPLADLLRPVRHARPR